MHLIPNMQPDANTAHHIPTPCDASFASYPDPLSLLAEELNLPFSILSSRELSRCTTTFFFRHQTYFDRFRKCWVMPGLKQDLNYAFPGWMSHMWLSTQLWPPSPLCSFPLWDVPRATSSVQVIRNSDLHPLNIKPCLKPERFAVCDKTSITAKLWMG